MCGYGCVSFSLYSHSLSLSLSHSLSLYGCGYYGLRSPEAVNVRGRLWRRLFTAAAAEAEAAVAADGPVSPELHSQI